VYTNSARGLISLSSNRGSAEDSYLMLELNFFQNHFLILDQRNQNNTVTAECLTNFIGLQEMGVEVAAKQVPQEEDQY